MDADTSALFNTWIAPKFLFRRRDREDEWLEVLEGLRKWRGGLAGTAKPTDDARGERAPLEQA
jgi:hypothetical protein